MKEFHTDGTADENFKAVRESFRGNFVDGWEKGGAAFAVYHKGRLVVDLWGGYADKSCIDSMERDTMTLLVSGGHDLFTAPRMAESVAAICVAILVDRGLCSYNDKVTQYWPEFGQNGKADITIEMILAHKVCKTASILE
ncbi:hypothetical protein COOONC_11442 [Cooperia oncophora]